MVDDDDGSVSKFAGRRMYSRTAHSRYDDRDCSKFVQILLVVKTKVGGTSPYLDKIVAENKIPQAIERV